MAAPIAQTRGEIDVRNGGPGRDLVLVTKSDAVQAVPFVALRVYVASADAPATLKITPVDANDAITLTYPAGLFWEPCGAKTVWSNGSTANAIVHGVPARNSTV